MIFKKYIYAAAAKVICKYGYVVSIVFWYGAIVILLLPSLFLEWKYIILSIPVFSDFYSSMTSRSIGYYLSLSGVVFSALMYSYSKLNQSMVAIFPNDALGVGDLKACQVVENKLYPTNIKQEYIFWVWVFKNAFFAIWAPQLLFGVLGYLFS
jgi:hypothetical protein